jgi:hypothetical protein
MKVSKELTTFSRTVLILLVVSTIVASAWFVDGGFKGTIHNIQFDASYDYIDAIGGQSQTYTPHIFKAIQTNFTTGKGELAEGFGSTEMVGIMPYNNDEIEAGKLIIMGISPVRIYGDIMIGDKLIVSNRPGVLTNLKDKEIPTIQYNFNNNKWVKGTLPASDNPKIYNSYDSAQGFSATVVGRAMNRYNSTQTGFILAKIIPS